MISTFVVDDEVPARNELKRFLQKETDFQVVGEANNGQEALALIRQLKPNVVFLDIHIPKLSGLEVAAELSKLENPPLVIFVTAFDEYAIRAFEVNAVDYILKPYDQARFSKTCVKIRHMIQDQPLIKEKLKSIRSYAEKERPLKIAGYARKSRDRVLIHPEEVLYFHVELTEVTAKLVQGDELLVHTTLKSLLDALDSNRFQQTHRSYVVNLDQVQKVIPMFGGNYELLLKDVKTARIPLSRRYARKLKQLLKW